MDEVQITIIGAGVVGLAVAAAISRNHGDVVLLERHDKFGRETSSRNSEVIHAGIYYEPGTMKAKLCVKGRELLYRYCYHQNVPYSKTGKLIIAAENAEIPRLTELLRRGEQNGVSGLSILEKDEVRSIEPRANAQAAILSTETGVVDSHSLMKQLHDEAESAGVIFSFSSEADYIENKKDGWVIGINKNDYRFSSRVLINAAGLSSDHVAEMAGIDIDSAGYRLDYCKGSYFSYAKKPPVGKLVYPVPEVDMTGLGIHATLDLGGRLRFGPDTEYVDGIDYSVDNNKRDLFYRSASKIINGLDRSSLHPDMAGIRPRIKSDKVSDFIIKEEGDRGLTGFINLIGIESPGLTASLAIAEHVANLI